MLLLCQTDAHDPPANLCRNLLHSTVSPEAHWYARQSRFAEQWPHSPEHPGEALDGSAGVRCAGNHRIRYALSAEVRDEFYEFLRMDWYIVFGKRECDRTILFNNGEVAARDIRLSDDVVAESSQLGEIPAPGSVR